MKNHLIMTTVLGRNKSVFALCAALLHTISYTARADYASEILSENPIAYYRFNDGMTSYILDSGANSGSLGTAANLVYVPSAIKQQTGALVASSNKAITASGLAASVPYQAAMNSSGSFTAEVWLKPSVIPDPGALICPIASWRENTDTFGREGWLIYQGDATTGFNFRTYNKNGAAVALSINSGAGVNAGAWQHVVVTWDSTTNQGKIYVNGVLKNTSATVVPGGVNNRTFDPNSINPYTLGSRSDGAFVWAGGIDEPAYYTSVLSDSQVLAHYNNGINASPATNYDALVAADSPAGYWRLNESVFVPSVAANAGSLGVVANGGYYGESKNTNTGPNSAGGFLGFGASNSALSLTSAAGHVGTTQSLLNNRTAYTVSGWVKRGAIKSLRGGYFGQNDLLEFGDNADGANIEAWLSARGNIVNPYSFADDTWGFIALTADENKTTLYLNGAQVGQLTGTIANYGTSIYPFNIGGGGVFNVSGDYFRGEIDEVAVFDKAVTPGRVKQLYDTALGNVAPYFASAPTASPSNVVAEGQSYTLSVDPAGTPPFTYQWKVGGVPISGANAVSYTVPSAAAQSPVLDPFEYTCEVTNATASTTSDILNLYVTPALVWDGADATNPSFWDIANTANWKSYTAGVTTTYDNDFSILFTDAASSTLVEITEDIEPQEVIFDHTSKDFTLGASPFGIGGTTAVTKKGSGLATILSNNYYTGATTVVAGTLVIGDGTDGYIAGTSPISITGGTMQINYPEAAVFTNSGTVAAVGQLKFVGEGSLGLTGANELTGAGAEIFDRDGVVTVDRINRFSNVSILQSEVAFNGSQSANRLSNSANVTVFPGATMTIRGVNALPTGVNSVNINLNESVLNVITGQDTHGHLFNLNLNGGTIQLSTTGGNAYNGESFQLNGNITVTGSTGSFINTMPGADLSNSGIALKGDRIFHVTNATGNTDADLTVRTELESPDDNLGSLTKTGDGTLFLADNIAHSYPGATTITAGTLVGTGSLNSPLLINSTATLALGAGIGTFTAKDTTIAGTVLCDINGANSDKLIVNGNLTMEAGAKIQITAVAASAPFYVICSYTGNATDNGSTISGVPPGYDVVYGFNSILISKNANFTPSLTIFTGSTPAVLSTGNFNANNGNFGVSATVSAETDWIYNSVDGTWRSNGQSSGLGSNNVSYLTSELFTLTQSGAVELTFSHRHSYEFYAPIEAYDAGAVEVSLNGGPFQIVPLSAFTENGYNGTVIDYSTISLAGQKAFVGNSAGHPAYITSKCKLIAGKPGDTVQFRFMSASDNNTSGDLTPAGWEVDSYEITEGKGAGGMISWPLGVLEYSDNLLPPWTPLGSNGPLFFDPAVAPKRFFRIKP